MLGRFVLCRTYSAGVHFGTLTEMSSDGKMARLVDARRLWSWTGANTLHEIALHGVGDGSHISEPVSEIVLTEVIEYLFPTPEAKKNLEGRGWN